MDTKSRNVDINCDLGEGETLADCAHDALLMPYLSRCNIACGGHAGNNVTMRETLLNAKANALKCGAHPGYPDKANFGRSTVAISSDQLLDNLRAQIIALEEQARLLSVTLDHVKLHGALYNDAEKSPELATKICQMFAQYFPHLTVMGLPSGAMKVAAQQQSLTFLREGFMDRAYLANGQLAPRSERGAVYESTEQCVQQVLDILAGQTLATWDNQQLSVEVDSLCLHGDSKIALELAVNLQKALAKNHWVIA